MINFFKKIYKIFTSKQFIKYFISGGSAFIVDFTILNILIYVLKFNPYKYFDFKLIVISISYANLISSFFGMIVSYILNRYFAFQSKNSVVKEGGKFLVVVLCNYIISNILFGAIVHIGVSEPITKFITIALQMVWTYFLYKSFVFKK